MDELVVQGEISSKIFTLRGRQVMLDKDLAELYHVETKYLKRQVQRNMERFNEEDFMFIMTKEEFDDILDSYVNKDLFEKIDGKWEPKFEVGEDFTV